MRCFSYGDARGLGSVVTWGAAAHLKDRILIKFQPTVDCNVKIIIFGSPILLDSLSFNLSFLLADHPSLLKVLRTVRSGVKNSRFFSGRTKSMNRFCSQPPKWQMIFDSYKMVCVIHWNSKKTNSVYRHPTTVGKWLEKRLAPIY